MSINKDKGSGIKGEEALKLIQRIMLEEGFSKGTIDDFYFLLKDDVRKRKTICRKAAFEDAARLIFVTSKRQLESGHHFEVAKRILQLFRNETKSKIKIFVEDNLNYILVSLSITSIIVPIILKFV